jgi:hypothetical protein
MSAPRRLVTGVVLAAALCCGAAGAAGFQFGVIGHSFKNGADESVLKQAIQQANAAHLAFTVATGIKAGGEPCSDKLYNQRRELFNDSAGPLVVSLAASDWSACRNSAGRSDAIERLIRIREVYFADSTSLGGNPMTLTRLSSTASFRSYAENAHWEFGNVLFATINLPANNNHYLSAAGRNSEFEDRLVANRSWIKRLFSMAQRRRLAGLVLFSDGNVGVHVEESRWQQVFSNNKEDGFATPRRQIKVLADKFAGQVLLVDTQPLLSGNNEQGKGEQAPIAWRQNLGHVSVTSNWVEIDVAAAATSGSGPGAAKATKGNAAASKRPLFTITGGGPGTPGLAHQTPH